MNTAAVQSPLFEPVLWGGSGFKVLDELQLPDKVFYIEVNTVAEAVDAVREMKTRAFGQVLTFLYAGALIARDYSGQHVNPLREKLAQMTQLFCDARPTFDFRGLGRYLDRFIDKLQEGCDCGSILSAQIVGFARQIIGARGARAKRAAELLPNPARLLTHCNVSGELVAVAANCKKLGKEFSVIATETRPYLQGARLTAWELAQAGVPVSLVPDCAIAQVIAKGAVNAVIVGADRVAQNGDVINKVGTYPIARLAAEYGVPFHALVQDPGSLACGTDLTIEERPADELLRFQDEALIPGEVSGVNVRYPAFDVTPARFITNLIGFEDVDTPETFRRKYQKSPETKDTPARVQAKYLLVYGLAPKNQLKSLRTALRAENADSVLVPEMRPQLWGPRLLARELVNCDIPITLISDDMMGTLFAQGEIGKLWWFYDEIDGAGARGACGSLLAVQLARLHGVPVELFQAAPGANCALDRDVSTFMGKRNCPAGVSIWPIESETVPWALLKQ